MKKAGGSTFPAGLSFIHGHDDQHGHDHSIGQSDSFNPPASNFLFLHSIAIIMPLKELLYQHSHSSDGDKISLISGYLQSRLVGAGVFDAITRKVGRLLVMGEFSRSEVDDLIELIACKKSLGEIDRVGPYFTACVKRMMKTRGIPWASR